MNAAPTVPAYLTKDGGAVYLEELPALKGIRFFNARCFNAEGQEYAFFPSIAESTLLQTAQLLDWTKNTQEPAPENPGSRRRTPAAPLASAHEVRVWPDEEGWMLTIGTVDGNAYVINIHAVAESLLDQMVQVQDWLAQP